MFLHPERAIGQLDIKKGMTVADFGAGSGFFTIAAARLVGEEGKMYAIDIQKENLEVIKSKAKTENLLNIETVWADLELPRGSHLVAESVDLVVISNILFQVDKKAEVMREAWRVLKPRAMIAVIEWDETPFSGGPSAELRIPKRNAVSLLVSAGFTLDREFEVGSHHYGLMYKKS